MTTPPKTDRRGPDRTRVLIPATAICSDGAEFRCVLRDISTTGALIGIATASRLPSRFRLATGARPQGFPVRLVWQRGAFAGLSLEAVQP